MSQTNLPLDHATRMARVRLALDGLATGDAFGEQFFLPANGQHLEHEEPFLPPGPWPYTDDTEMALGLSEVLDRNGCVNQDQLARTFARRFRHDPYRGYGPGAFRLLTSVAAGGDWRLESKALFGGMGSFGNGSAMRVAPVGAYFAEDGYEKVAEQAALSAEVTHRHPEGIAGGVAIAVAAAYAWQNRAKIGDAAVRQELFAVVLAHSPGAGDVRMGIEHASIIEPSVPPLTASHLLGNGSRVSCQDTVPFCVWVIARHLNDYQAAIWNTVRVGGDIDTTAAIVGGVVALAVGPDGIPPLWRTGREELKYES